MPDIIHVSFVEWTNGLSGKDARISVFNHVRDIPYAVVPEINNPVDGPEGLLRMMKGSCGPKHFLLARMFEKLQIPTQYVTYPFSWNDKSVAYPPKLRMLSEAVPISYHLACKARIEDRWVIVDATWDRPLARVGFPVNEGWDGASDTKLAVEPLDDPVQKNAQERTRFVQACEPSWAVDDHARTDRFTTALNRWLEDVRRNSSS